MWMHILISEKDIMNVINCDKNAFEVNVLPNFLSNQWGEKKVVFTVTRPTLS